MRQKFVLRVRILTFFAILAAILLVVRLYFLQIVHGDDYRAAALGQYVENSGAETPRGNIFFTRKDGTEVAAAVMQGGWRIALNPKLLADPESAYERLSKITPIEKDRFLASAAKKDDPYEEVAFKLSDDEAEAVRNLKIKGVTTVREEWRSYPAGQLAAHALGFVAFVGDKKNGVYGLERYYEDTLRHDGGGLYINPSLDPSRCRPRDAANTYR
jgi:stage V sporulation protein D (sporulation-specific penicillin-binding protein)